MTTTPIRTSGTPSTPAGLGLRERKKEATRLALHRAAVQLSIEHGFDQVTVEAIADDAQVSRRTFSNYFANKEDAVLWTDVRRAERLVLLVAERPAGEPAWTALSGAAEQLLAERDTDPEWNRQLRLLRSHPILLARQVATLAAAERALAEAISRRLEDDPDQDVLARLMASTLLSAVRITLQTSVDQPEREPRELLHHLLTLAASPWA